jgi:hypothetical protein
MRYELWQESDSVAFFPENNVESRAQLEPGAKLIFSCEADSWEEAKAKMEKFRYGRHNTSQESHES